MVVAGIACALTGVAYYLLTQDTPEGDLKQLRAAGKLPSSRDVRGTFLEACRDKRVWALAIMYGACFGIELTVNNVAALYFVDYFAVFREMETIQAAKYAGLIAASFGLMNLFARTLGGVFGDKCGSVWGLPGRVKWLFVTLFCEGLLLIVFSQMNALVLAIPALVVFSLFVQMSEGATFAIVPFVNRRALGSVAGIVGAGGNAGAVAAGFLFKAEGLSWPTAFLLIGATVTAISFLGFAVRFNEEAEAEFDRQLDAGARSCDCVSSAGPAGILKRGAPAMANPVEVWKAEKHGLDVWPDVERHAAAGTPMKQIDAADLERMKWYGFFYRKRDEAGRYMNRIRITANEMTAAQAKEIARLAYDFGHGIVDVTTRANVQIQGLSIEHLPEVRKRLEGVGLTSKQTGHDNIRNVFGHPFSGLMADELIDTRDLCHQVTALFVDSREYSDLPRKMNICLNGTGEHSAHFWTQDVSYLATRVDSGEVLFRVLIGGTQGQNPHLAWHLGVLVAPHQVVDVTRSILDLYRAQGSREKRNAARFCFLMDEIGVEGVLAWLDEDLDFPLLRCHRPPPPSKSHDELIGWFPQADAKLWTMGLSVPLGRMTWQQLEGLGVLAERWGEGGLRTTHEQGMAVVNIPTRHKQAALTDAAALGLSIHADALDRNTMACTGSQFCNIAVTETKGHMFQLLEKLRKKQVRLEGIRIHMSGCPSSCAQHFTADIGLKGVRVRRLLGTREGFDVFLGGGIGDGVQMGRTFRLGVDVDQLPTLIEEVVTQYYLSHKPGQTFSAYWREQLPDDSSVKAGDDDFKLPIWLCENCRYEHVGVDPPVFCPSCAGLRRYFARLEEADDRNGSAPAAEVPAPEAPARGDGFAFAAAESSVPEGEGLSVEVGGKELALFRVGGRIHAIDALCPHEGARWPRVRNKTAS